MDFVAFPNLKIKDSSFLDEIVKRSQCCKCARSRMYFCYDCHIPVKILEGRLPHVDLPFKVVIIKYVGELSGKSTSAHATILASKQTFIHTYPSVPDFSKEENCVVLFPNENAMSIEKFVKNKLHWSHAKENGVCKKFTSLIGTVILIDCTWNQTLKILVDPKIKDLPFIKLKDYETKYWRPLHKKPKTCLSTIEAIYYCAVEYTTCIKSLKSYMNGDGENLNSDNFNEQMSREADHSINSYDNLLFFFSFFYTKIRRDALITGKKLRSYEGGERVKGQVK